MPFHIGDSVAVVAFSLPSCRYYTFCILPRCEPLCLYPKGSYTNDPDAPPVQEMTGPKQINIDHSS